MKLSRLLGAAVTWGTLFSGSIVQAQVNYYPASKTTYPNVAPALLTPPTYYPSTYPSTSGYTYSVASLPTGYTQFSGPLNAPVTRLPPSNSPTLVGHTPSAGMTGLNMAPATGSILASPTPAPTPAVNGGVFNGALNRGAFPAEGSGSYPASTGIGNYSPSNVTPGGNGSNVGSSAFQPFAGPDNACGIGNCVTPNCWYGGLYGLALTRNRQEHYTFSYDTANESVQYTDAKDADTGWGGGFAAVAGRYFNCGCNAVEAVYWGWFPQDSSTFTFGATQLAA